MTCSRPPNGARRRGLRRAGPRSCRCASAWPCCSTRAASSRTGCWPRRPSAGHARATASSPASGTVEGRPVAVIAHDFAVKAGSWGELTCEKQIRILERADRDLLPVVYLVDSAGGRLTDQMGFFPGRRGASRSSTCRCGCPGGCRRSAACTARRPRAAPTCRRSATGSGWSTGNGVDVPGVSPRVAEKVTGERTTLEEMGGARMHADGLRLRRRGVRRGLGGDRRRPAAAVLPARRLPLARPPTAEPRRARDATAGTASSPRTRTSPTTCATVDRPARRRRHVLRDQGPLGAGDRGRVSPASTAGSSASSPTSRSVRSGAIFVDSADKAARFISLCDAFNVPLVFLQDVPGFMVGVDVERAGDHPPRREDDRRDGVGRGPEVHRRAAQGLRRGLLRDVRAGLRAARHARAAHRHDRRRWAPEASVNAVYANKIAAIEDEDERAAFVAARAAEQQRRHQPAAHGRRPRRRRGRRAGERLRAELVARLRRRRRLDPHQPAAATTSSAPSEPTRRDDRCPTIATPSAP